MPRSEHSPLATVLPVIACLLTAAAPCRATSEPRQDSTVEAAARARATFLNLPMTFEANRGQTDPQVRFLSRGNGYSVFLTGKEAVLALWPASKDAKARGAVVRMTLAGANPSPDVAGEQLLPGRANYLLGKDPKKWRTDVPLYERVRYRNAYAGIDVVFYGNQ